MNAKNYTVFASCAALLAPIMLLLGFMNDNDVAGVWFAVACLIVSLACSLKRDSLRYNRKRYFQGNLR